MCHVTLSAPELDHTSVYIPCGNSNSLHVLRIYTAGTGTSPLRTDSLRRSNSSVRKCCHDFSFHNLPGPWTQDANPEADFRVQARPSLTVEYGAGTQPICSHAC